MLLLLVLLRHFIRTLHTGKLKSSTVLNATFSHSTTHSRLSHFRCQFLLLYDFICDHVLAAEFINSLDWDFSITHFKYLLPVSKDTYAYKHLILEALTFLSFRPLFLTWWLSHGSAFLSRSYALASRFANHLFCKDATATAAWSLD